MSLQNKEELLNFFAKNYRTMRKNESENRSPMRLIIYAVVVNLALTVFLLVWNFSGNKSSRIVYVDAAKLVSNYQGMQEAKIGLEGKIAGYNSNLDTLKMELDGKISEYDAKKSRLSLNEKILFEELIASKQLQFSNYQQMIQEKVQNENLQLTQKVLDRINEYVKRYGKEHNLKLILAATQYGNIIYGEDDVDITQVIIDGLNKEYQSGAGK